MTLGRSQFGLELCDGRVRREEELRSPNGCLPGFGGS